MNYSTILSVVIAIFLISSCSPSIKVADTSCPVYKSDYFQRNDISDEGLAIMPEIGPNQNELITSNLREEITRAFREEFGEKKIVTPVQVISMLKECGLSEEYMQALAENSPRGMLPRTLMEKAGRNLEVDNLLLVKLLPDSYIQHSKKMQMREIYFQIEVWNAINGELVWKGRGGYAVYKDPRINITAESAKSLVQIIGSGPGEGPCETTAEVVTAVRVARGKTGIALAISGLVTVLLFPAFIELFAFAF